MRRLGTRTQVGISISLVLIALVIVSPVRQAEAQIRTHDRARAAYVPDIVQTCKSGPGLKGQGGQPAVVHFVPSLTDSGFGGPPQVESLSLYTEVLSCTDPLHRFLALSLKLKTSNVGSGAAKVYCHSLLGNPIPNGAATFMWTNQAGTQSIGKDTVATTSMMFDTTTDTTSAALLGGYALTPQDGPYAGDRITGSITFALGISYTACEALYVDSDGNANHLPISGIIVHFESVPVSTKRHSVPNAGAGYLVGVGDSAMSGEGGRWAGNAVPGFSARTDAYPGGDAYHDNPADTAEQIYRCHRAKSDQVLIGGNVTGVNFACSGAQTTTHFCAVGVCVPNLPLFKPGLDFFPQPGGDNTVPQNSDFTGGNVTGAETWGQALMLQQYAWTHTVRAVTVMIGINNFDFQDIIERCVKADLAHTLATPYRCDRNPSGNWAQWSVTNHFSPANQLAVRAADKTALDNVEHAMTNAGYPTWSYKLIIQLYSSAFPSAGGFKYPQGGGPLGPRFLIGKCAFLNDDATYLNAVGLPAINNAIRGAAATEPNAVVLDTSQALSGHRLCERGTALIPFGPIHAWTSPAASQISEWMNQIYPTDSGKYLQQESIHPNYWGRLAYRNCLRDAYHDGSPRSGRCKPVFGMNAENPREPNMIFTPT